MSRASATTVNVKIVGHELKEWREKPARKGDEPNVYDMLHVKMQGLGDDKKTRVTIVVDPDQAARFPLGDNGEISFEIRQGKLGLSTATAH
jgi:hypothetical protein